MRIPDADGEERVFVELLSIGVDRVADGLGMRHEKEEAEVRLVGREIEEAPHGGPVGDR